MKNGKMFMVAILVLALAALACGIGGGGGQTSEEATAEPAPSGGETSEVSTSEEEAPPAPASTEQDLTLSTLTEGLAALKSYKSTFTVQFVGKDEQGQPVDGSLVTQEEFTQEPRAQRVAITSSGFSQGQVESGTFEMITIGDTSYMVTEDADGERSCVAMSSDEDTQPEQGLFSPDVMGGVSGAKYVGEETVNGLRAKHYTWKEGSLGVLGFASAEGEVWVAVDGEYVVKYTAEATGKGMLFGTTEEEGTVTVEYNLTEVNGSFQIEPPADCEAPATDIPIMPDAQEKSAFGEMVTYTSASAFADVVAFYKTEMPNSGWQPSGEPAEMEGFATLEFTKDGRTAQVMVSYDEEEQVTDVIITTGEE